MIFRTLCIALLFAVALTGSAFAGGMGDLKTYTTKGAFNDVTEDVENAILNRGYVIDYHGFVSNMLKRTGKDIGSTKAIYKDAEFYSFCSAKLTRTAVEANPRNIGFCPYVVVVYALASSPDKVNVGYRRLSLTSSGASKTALAAVDKVLDAIAREATE